jgi:hypothetical protein
MSNRNTLNQEEKMDYTRVEDIILNEYYKITSIDTFKELIGGEAGIEAIKDYVNYFTDENLISSYSEDNYIMEFLQDMIVCANNDSRFQDLLKFAEVLYSLFKNW